MHLTGVPVFISPDKQVYMDALAARDLRRHTYLGGAVRVVCPSVKVAAPPPGTVAFRQPGFEFVGLPHATSLLRYVLTGAWLRAVWMMWRQLAWPDIAFIGFVEHPIPYGWTAAPFAALRRVPWYTYIESTPWRVPPGVTAKRRHRFRALVMERVNPFFLRRATFAFVSQPAYADFLRPNCPRLVSPASWFLRDEIATTTEVEAARSEAGRRVPHLMYVGRLDPSKGVDVLLSALAVLDATDVRFTFTVMGAGQMRALVEHAVTSLHNVRLIVEPPMRYGPDFFKALRRVDALVVPSLGDEQPRNVFDAFSQAVPVLAADTTGLRSLITDGVEGRLTPAGDAVALSAAIGEILQPETRSRWLTFGDNGYQRALAYDHDAMHAQRAEFISGL